MLRATSFASHQLPGALWAKKSRTGEHAWLPLSVHLTDCAQVARLLWRDWVPEGVKRTIASGLGAAAGTSLQDSQLEQARKLFIFLAGCHDLGKATPGFQFKPATPAVPVEADILSALRRAGFVPGGLATSSIATKDSPHHSLAGQLLLEEAGLHPQIAAVLGAHHGKPVDVNQIFDYSLVKLPAFYGHSVADGQAWKDAQRSLMALCLQIAGFDNLEELPVPGGPAALLLSGLVIMADWIASAEELFPLIAFGQAWSPEELVEASKARARSAWTELKLPRYWLPGQDWMQADFLHQRFGRDIPGFAPRLSQIASVAQAGQIKQPGILVLEAPMGAGKTEAALAIAEIFAAHSQRAGLFFALPTQATGDAMFSRVAAWAQGLLKEDRQSIRLAHGKAQFNEDYQRLFAVQSTMGQEEQDSRIFVHEWFSGQKKALLADFVVGTIDQLLLCALRQKHVMLRHLGLAGKVVIIDECHAYDAYMSRYLARALRWLGKYQVPVIVLSATLPAERRKQVVAAYLGLESKRQQAKLAGDWQTSRAYPLMTWTDGDTVHSLPLPHQSKATKVQIHPLVADQLPALLGKLLADGGCAGILRNTVKEAQQTAQALRAFFPAEEIRLLHSRFIAPHRAKKEQELLGLLGRDGQRPHRLIVVGTQVLEQSLDIDFDVLISDLCPMDLLLQRMGRLHRHQRARPQALQEAQIYVLGLGDVGSDLGPDQGSRAVYGDYLLARTQALLPEAIVLPTDIPELVQDTYDTQLDLPISGYAQMKARWNKELADRVQRATNFLLREPQNSIEGMLSLPATQDELIGQASVRDGDESIEVLLVQQAGGLLRVLEEAECAQHIDPHLPLQDGSGRLLARQRLRLPAALCNSFRIQHTIRELMEMNAPLSLWQQSPWIQGELFLILDESGQCSLGGHLLCYTVKNGLIIEEKGEKHAFEAI